MEACASYVAMLQSRRVEEEASRANRSQRRANTVAAYNEMYKRRANTIRRRSMEEKMMMTSFKEQELFEELSALSKWRHVMYENISHRESQHADAQHLQETLLRGHLDNVRHHEEQQLSEAIRDDKERFDLVLKATVEHKQRTTLTTCQAVVDDVLRGIDEHIDFMVRHDLEGKDAVPPALSDAIARQVAFPTDPSAVQESLLYRHVEGALYSKYNAVNNNNETHAPDASALHSKLFVSLVHKILHLQYPKPPPFKPKNPSALPVVAIVGPKFSGKTTIATAVAMSMGMLRVADIDLIQMALNEFSRDLTPNDWNSETSAELLDLGRECQESLLNGKPVSVKLLARLIMYKLRHLPEDCAGVLLDGSPSTVEGYEHLEQALSGYDKTRVTTIPDEVLAPLLEDVNIDDPIFNLEKVDTSLLADASQQVGKKDAKPAKPKGKKDEHDEPLPPVDLPIVEPVPPLSEEEEEAIAACERDADVSSIHAVLHVEVSAEELFKRFAGLRVDSETGAVYHLVMNPPPPERLPFLVAKDRADASTAKLHKMVEQHLEDWSECMEWLSRYEGLVHHLDGSKAQSDLINAAMDLTSLAAENAAAYYQRYCLAEEVRQRQAEMEQMYQERLANRENVRKQLANIYLDRGVDLPLELQEPPKANEVQFYTLPSDFPHLFMETLHSFTKYYSSCVNQGHTELQHLVRQLFEYGNQCEGYINVYWNQPDPKQAALDAFITEFNQMQPALRRDIQGKEELHLRAEQLNEQLFAVVDRRKEECTQLIDALHHRQTLTDAWSDAVRCTGIALIQAEVERFFTVRNLALMYFGALKNDPTSVEDELLELVPQLKLIAQESSVDAKAAKDKKAPPPKKGGKGAEENAEKAPEDIFTPSVEKALQIIKSALEKMSVAVNAAPLKGKGDKGKGPAAETPSGLEGPSVQGLALPIVNEEIEAAKQRIQNIIHFIKETVALGLRRVEAVRSKLISNLRKKQMIQSSAVNSAVFEIRCAIEEERPVLFHLHLGTDSFSIDTTKPLATMADAVCLSGVPFAGLAAPPVENIMLLTSLTKARVMELIRDFKILASSFDINKQDFVRLVRPSDYVDANPRHAPQPVDVIFDRFDNTGCGFIDWRDFLVHLLFWCEPVSQESSLFDSTNSPSMGIEGPSLTQLFDMRADIGSELLAKDEFLDTPLFFEGNMEEDRLMAYLNVLWEIFNINDSVHPETFLTFFCPDPQPLRGIQKAFVIAANPGDETCSGTLEALDTVFHMNATCPRRMLMHDPHATETLASLFPEGCETLVFGDACKTHIGRVLFNSTKTFLRKTFV